MDKAFTIIEMMISLAIVAVLSAVAIPAYQDYVTRARMAEPFAMLSHCKVKVVDYYYSEGVWPHEIYSRTREEVTDMYR